MASSSRGSSTDSQPITLSRRRVLGAGEATGLVVEDPKSAASRFKPAKYSLLAEGPATRRRFLTHRSGGYRSWLIDSDLARMEVNDRAGGSRRNLRRRLGPGANASGEVRRRIRGLRPRVDVGAALQFGERQAPILQPPLFVEVLRHVPAREKFPAQRDPIRVHTVIDPDVG